jgi:hypothetical protein
MTTADDVGSETFHHRAAAQRRRRVSRRTTALVGALGLVGLVLTGCGADPNDVLAGLAPHGVAPPGGVAVNGLLDEWRVRADADTVRAGQVTFTFENVGTVVHEMLVTRTDIALGKIPVDSAVKKFNEDDPSSQVVGEISEFDPGKTASVTLDLTPGSYQLVCNVPGHYTDGMSMEFTVTP